MAINSIREDELARLVFEDVQPTNPHGSQSDLYYGMPYCKYESERALKIARNILAKYEVTKKDGA